jgi:beta-lactam-binding protein with PASTA domain
VTVTKESVSDPGEQGIVVNQKPGGGTSAPAGSTVTIFVGDYTGTTTAVP